MIKQKREGFSKTLLIFEFKDEIDSFLARRPIDEFRNENTLILALTPEAQIYLKRMNIQFLDTYDLFGKAGHEQAVLQSDRIYQFCKPLLSVEDDIGIKEGYGNVFLFYLRCYVHYLFWLIEVIENACVKWDIKKVIGFQRDNRHIGSPFLSASEGCTASIGERVARKLNLDFEPMHTTGSARGLFLKRLKKYAGEIIKLLIFQVKIKLLSFLYRNKKIILATSRTYNLGRVLDDFARTFKNVQILCLNSKKGKPLHKLLYSAFSGEILQLPGINAFSRANIFRKKLGDNISRIEAGQGNGDVFQFRDIPLKDLIFEKIRGDIIPELCDVYAQSVYLSILLDKFRPTFIIAQMARGINYNLGELASMHNIPSLLISHGSHIPPGNEYEAIECGDLGLGLINTRYKYIALQTPWAKAYIYKIPVISTPIVTGPLLFASIGHCGHRDELLEKKNLLKYKDKIILLHADTPRLRGTFRFYVYQTVDEYISSLNRLIRAMENIGGFYLIIRFRPQPHLSKEQLRELLIESDCYTICDDGTFEEYLSLSDMLVSYSSTTIEEALQNKIPVVLFDQHGKYCHIKDAKDLNSRADTKMNCCYHIGSAGAIEASLNWLKENHFPFKKSCLDWSSHIFDENEKIALTSYFGYLFKDNNAVNLKRSMANDQS